MRHKSSMSAKNNSSSLESSHGGSCSRSVASHTERSKRGGGGKALRQQRRAEPGRPRISVALGRSLSLAGSAVPPRLSAPWPTWRTFTNSRKQSVVLTPARPGPLGYTTAIPTQWGARARSRSLRAGVGERAMERPSERGSAQGAH